MILRKQGKDQLPREQWGKPIPDEVEGGSVFFEVIGPLIVALLIVMVLCGLVDWLYWSARP